DAVLGDELELAAEHAAMTVDLLHRHFRGVLAVDAELAEEAGEWGQMSELDGVGLGLADGREADDAEHRRPGGALEHAAAREPLDLGHGLPPMSIEPSERGFLLRR